MSDLDPTDQSVETAVDAAIDAVAAAADDEAAEPRADREELLKRAIVALAESEGIEVPDAEEVAAIRSRLDALDDEVDEKVEDLRDRFVELYRDLESKAPADHAHPETAQRLDALAADLDRIAARLDEVEGGAAGRSTVDEAVEETVDDLDDRLRRVESRAADLDDLESRIDDVDVEDLDDKLSRVASAVVRVRRRLEAAERDRADREHLDALTAAANRHGVRKAACTDCGGTVGIGLLTAPECPHCGRQFAELEPNPGFLGTSRLVVGDRPALDGDVDAGGASGGVSTRDADGERGTR
ncbi:hypothetical protein U4E84_16245 [Halorubrum sp. AD140]|uniref:hypothetical protein n=1 Tax=Halorubrum sp. AD140 TaxID=3050073 RepID=UPI002ACC6616|nr:hypothetical protein [Halorubrum sp. AD140]MDZ5812891.1 hypothetical protein [Halorubrum sp. AD140]